MKVYALLLFLVCVPFPASAQDVAPQQTQRPDALYRLFPTANIYTMVKLNTETGQAWQVQWGDTTYRWTVPIATKVLAPNGKPGRFTLYPTPNIYTFLLLDQEDGRTWQLQWGKSENERFVLSIP